MRTRTIRERVCDYCLVGFYQKTPEGVKEIGRQTFNTNSRNLIRQYRNQHYDYDIEFMLLEEKYNVYEMSIQEFLKHAKKVEK